MAIRRSIWRTVTSNTNRSFHEDPSPQARYCTRNWWSSRSGRHGPIACCTDQWQVDQGGGTGGDDRRALSGVSGLSLRFGFGLSHLLLLLRISLLLDLFTVLCVSAVLRLRLVMTPGIGSGGSPPSPPRQHGIQSFWSRTGYPPFSFSFRPAA